VIRQIQNSDAVNGAAPAQSPSVAPATAAGKTTFASHLASQKTAATGGAAAPAPLAKQALTTPAGEEWTPVKGHDHYAKITSGPREGQYINLSRGARRGQTFSIEQRAGKTVHVYGKGATEVVVQAAKDSGKFKGGAVPADATRPKSEEWAPVKGANNYADILSGPRNGLYVNTSGGSRDGMAFQIVKHGEKTFHVYGKGKHRQVIEVHHSSPERSSSSSASNSTSSSAASQATGATGATTGGASPTT
jgi:hypothetical protein